MWRLSARGWPNYQTEKLQKTAETGSFLEKPNELKRLCCVHAWRKVMKRVLGRENWGIRVYFWSVSDKKAVQASSVLVVWRANGVVGNVLETYRRRRRLSYWGREPWQSRVDDTRTSIRHMRKQTVIISGHDA